MVQKLPFLDEPNSPVRRRRTNTCRLRVDTHTPTHDTVYVLDPASDTKGTGKTACPPFTHSAILNFVNEIFKYLVCLIHPHVYILDLFLFKISISQLIFRKLHRRPHFIHSDSSEKGKFSISCYINLKKDKNLAGPSHRKKDKQKRTSLFVLAICLCEDER